MGEIEWAMWANEHALISAVVALAGAIMAVVNFFHYWQFAAVTLATSVVTILIEYPRGKRKKGRTAERPHQVYLACFVNALGPVTKNYYSRFVIYLLFSIPACFVISTIIGGLSLIIASAIYLLAAIKGEEWSPISLDTERRQARNLASFSPPPRPPPRGHPGNELVTDDHHL